MEDREIKDLVISALVISLAFAMMFSDGIFGLFDAPLRIIPGFILALVTVSLSFIFHELGHRAVARFFGLYAEYKKWDRGLKLALIFSLFGFVFAAPGAVYIHAKSDLWGRSKKIGRKVNGLISSAGPTINIIMALVFIILGVLFPFLNSISLFGFTLSFISYGVSINSWLALFNTIPFGPLDGGKILAWKKEVWIGLLITSIILMFLPV